MACTNDAPMDAIITTPSLCSPIATVYLTYDAEHPPPHPGPSWTRFVCISDTHSHIYPVPPGDVLLHAGDLCSRGKLRHLQVTTDWLKTLPHPIKIIVAGNHDLCLDNDWREDGRFGRLGATKVHYKDAIAAQELVRSDALRRAHIYYLENESIEITAANGRTWSLYGSPGVRRYRLGAFQYEYGEGAGIYARIPSSTEILITHSPPLGICDLTRRGQAAGCEELAARLRSADLGRCRLHVFGHIHEAYGALISEEGMGSPDGRVSVNAALAYGGQAVIVDLKN